jgi:hypothetical protein
VPGWVSAPQAHSRVSNINFDKSPSKKKINSNIKVDI